MMSTVINARVVDVDSSEIDQLLSVNGRDHGGTQRMEAPETLTLNRLSWTLQTALEIRDILNLFYQALARCHGLSGLSFINPQRHCEHHSGERTQATLQYRLQTDTDYLGELELFFGDCSDDQPSSPLKIDRLVSALIFPLRNGLRYEDAVRASMTDNMTGLGNRVYLKSSLGQAIEEAHRYKRPLSVLFLDVDHFKTINDAHGHDAGDQVLQRVATIIQTVCRGSDMAFRFGGEEFVVLLNNTDVAGAKIAAERLRKSIAAHTFTLLDTATAATVSEADAAPSALNVTVSIGAASLSHNETVNQLLKRADEALYRAKAAGRNCSLLAEPHLSHA